MPFAVLQKRGSVRFGSVLRETPVSQFVYFDASNISHAISILYICNQNRHPTLFVLNL